MAALAAANVEVLSTEERGVSTGSYNPSTLNKPFHLSMLLICGLMLMVAVAGFWQTSVWDFGTAPTAILLIPAALLPGLFWHDRKSYERRDAALVLFWAVIILLLGTFIAPLGQRLRMPLRDSLLTFVDTVLGFNVAAIVAWTNRHAHIRFWLDTGYGLLAPFMLVATLLPPLLGKKKAAERFLLANGFCSLLSLPFSLLFPAIGPWVGYHFAGSHDQVLCESSMHFLRTHTGAPASLPGGAVTCPSFHVIWAILSAQALSSFRGVRFIAWPLSGLIIVSTVTTGWYYVADVLAGALVVAASLHLARQVSKPRALNLTVKS